MSEKYLIDERVIERAMQPYPDIPYIVPFSTPVVSFGDASKAEMLTVGINPSSVEFLTGRKNKKLIKGNKKRLIDTETLGHNKVSNLSRGEAINVIKGCYCYFDSDKNPYMTWFKHLNSHANSIFAADFLNGTSAHVDLVQWATDPVWGNIKDEIVRKSLLDNDKDFLKYQINQKQYRVVFLNGTQVFDATTNNDILAAAVFDSIPYKTKNGANRELKLYKGITSAGSLVLGWNKPFPGHYISAEELPRVMGIAKNSFVKQL